MPFRTSFDKPLQRVLELLRTRTSSHSAANTATPHSSPVDSPPVATTRREGNAEITEQALRKRKFKLAVYEQLLETTILSKLEPLLENAEVAIDVGGNVGHIAYYLSQHAKRVYSFEAVGAVYEQLEKLTRLAPNVYPQNCAISDFCGTADLYIDHNRLSNSGLHNVGEVEVSFKPKTEFKTAKTQVKSIDSLGLEPVDFIKIDVEGSELDVLKGAAKAIARFQPDILVEIYLPFCKYPPEEIFSFLFSRHYTCYYYNNESRELIQVADVAAGTEAVRQHHDLHDGDFLFTRKAIARRAAA